VKTAQKKQELQMSGRICLKMSAPLSNFPAAVTLKQKGTAPESWPLQYFFCAVHHINFTSQYSKKIFFVNSNAPSSENM
jgi:hypothetical protein